MKGILNNVNLSPTYGVALALIGASLLSLEVLFLRSLYNFHGFQILFYRSISVTIVFVLYQIFFVKRISFSNTGSFPLRAFVTGIFLSLSFFCYVFSILNTSVASSLLMLSVAPLISVFLSRLFLKEKLPKNILIVLTLIFFGMILIFLSSNPLSQTFGNIIALLGSFFFASSIVCSRAIKSNEIAYGGMFGGLLALIFAAALNIYFEINIIIEFKYAGVIVLMGLITTGAGMLFLLLSTKYLLAPYVSLIALAEVILAPIWTFLFFNEQIAREEFLGGSLILVSLAYISLNKLLNKK